MKLLYCFISVLWITIVHSEDKPGCACLPLSLCPRKFGESPLDMIYLSPMPPCLEPNMVRCCGMSISLAVDNPGPSEAIDVVTKHTRQEAQFMAAMDSYLKHSATSKSFSDDSQRETKSIRPTENVENPGPSEAIDVVTKHTRQEAQFMAAMDSYLKHSTTSKSFSDDSQRETKSIRPTENVENPGPLEAIQMMMEHIKQENEFMAAIDDYLTHNENPPGDSNRETKSIGLTGKNGVICGNNKCKANLKTNKEMNIVEQKLKVSNSGTEDTTMKPDIFLVYPEVPTKKCLSCGDWRQPQVILPTKRNSQEQNTTTVTENINIYFENTETATINYENGNVMSKNNQNNMPLVEKTDIASKNEKIKSEIAPQNETQSPYLQTKAKPQNTQSQQNLAKSHLHKLFPRRRPTNISPLTRENPKHSVEEFMESEDTDNAASEVEEITFTLDTETEPSHDKLTNPPTNFTFRTPPRHLMRQPTKSEENKSMAKNILELLREQSKSRMNQTLKSQPDILALHVAAASEDIMEQINLKTVHDMVNMRPTSFKNKTNMANVENRVNSTKIKLVEKMLVEKIMEEQKSLQGQLFNSSTKTQIEGYNSNLKLMEPVPERRTVTSVTENITRRKFPSRGRKRFGQKKNEEETNTTNTEQTRGVGNSAEQDKESPHKPTRKQRPSFRLQHEAITETQQLPTTTEKHSDLKPRRQSLHKKYLMKSTDQEQDGMDTNRNVTIKRTSYSMKVSSEEENQQPEEYQNTKSRILPFRMRKYQRAEKNENINTEFPKVSFIAVNSKKQVVGPSSRNTSTIPESQSSTQYTTPEKIMIKDEIIKIEAPRNTSDAVINPQVSEDSKVRGIDMEVSSSHPQGRFIPPMEIETGFQPMIQRRDLKIVGPIPLGFHDKARSMSDTTQDGIAMSQLQLPQPDLPQGFVSELSAFPQQLRTLDHFSLPRQFTSIQPIQSIPHTGLQPVHQLKAQAQFIAVNSPTIMNKQISEPEELLNQHRHLVSLHNEFNVMKAQYDMLLNRYADALKYYNKQYQEYLHPTTFTT